MQPHWDVERLPNQPRRKHAHYNRSYQTKYTHYYQGCPDQCRKPFFPPGPQPLRHKLGQGAPHSKIKNAEIADHYPRQRQDAKPIYTERLDQERHSKDCDDQWPSLAYEVESRITHEQLALGESFTR